MKLSLQAQLTKVETRADRTLKIVLSTQELSGTDAGLLMSLANEQIGAVLASSDTPLNDVEIPEPDVDAPSGKSPSQRLRNTLYVFWQQRGSKGSFETFYMQQMEILLNRIKDKLE